MSLPSSPREHENLVEAAPPGATVRCRYAHIGVDPMYAAMSPEELHLIDMFGLANKYAAQYIEAAKRSAVQELNRYSFSHGENPPIRRGGWLLGN